MPVPFGLLSAYRRPIKVVDEKSDTHTEEEAEKLSQNFGEFKRWQKSKTDFSFFVVMTIACVVIATLTVIPAQSHRMAKNVSPK